MELWVGCVVGALSDRDYRQKLAAAGFDADATAPKAQDKFISAFVRARKPAKAARRLLRFNALQYVKAAA